MTSGPLEFVGRVTELSALREAIASARGGRGSTWLLCGEPGIGKSRLVEELALEADAAGFLSLWGRCWEAGGAPAFWPWIQIVRELVRHAEDTVLAGARLSYVVQLIPELRDRYPDVAAPPSASDHAQFALLDAVTSALCAVSRTQPLFVALEDLHVATPSSLLLLELVSQHVRGAPIVVVGTYRHIDVPGETGQLLHRIAQAGRTLAMAPLGRDEIAMVLGQATGRRPDPTLVDLVTERTEGNPLFLVELCRLMVARGASADVPQELVPATLRTAILRRLAGLRAPVRALLELAATVGRELSPSRLTGAFALRAEDVRAGLAEAERLAIVAPTADGGFRFTHILIREVLYQELSVARRQELHLQVGRWLETYGTGDAAPPWSEIAHHYAAAGDAARDAAIDAMERAAQGACATLAYAEAISSYRRAVEAVDTTPGRDGRRRVDLMIGLAHAQLHGGDLEAGRDTCLAAAALARERGAPDLLARAALELGSVLRFASVDPVLVALLGEALAMLRPEDARLRARVLARLASAKQPSDRPGEGVELALEAVELARTTEHPPTLLAALSSASSALVDNVDPAVRLPIDREHLALATALGERTEELRGRIRIAWASFELGDLTGAHASLARMHELGERLAHPCYRWRALAATATVALWEGRFAEAEAAIEDAYRTGTDGRDPNARATYAFQTTRLARLTGRRERLRAGLVLARQLFAGTPAAEALMRIYAGAQELLLAPAASAPLISDDLELGLRDRASFESMAELALATGDRARAEALRALLATDAARFTTSGVVGMTWDAPLARIRALLERTLGNLDGAIDAMATAVELTREAGGAPMVAWTAHELAAMLLARGGPEDRARAATLLDEAEGIARELDMRSVSERIGELRGAPAADAPRSAPPTTAAAHVSLVRAGEVWTVTHDGAAFQLRDTKGLRYLARLIAEPRHELHALDLGEALGAVDGGDAGELLDARARDAYRRRVVDLEASLADAEARNDLGAAEHAREELEHLQAELARAVGLGGRERRAGAAVERARINVQRRLRTAIAQIAAHAPALGRHLERSVRTGVYCCYEPD